MQPKQEPKARDLVQAKADRLRELGTTGTGAEPFALFVEMLRIAEGDVKERLVEAEVEHFQSVQGEAIAIRKLLKALTQPKKLVQGTFNG